MLDYAPAPGQFVNNPDFNIPARALGTPLGGGTAVPELKKLVTLGGFGGSITLGFDHRVLKHAPTPTNPLGLDLIVFGNALWVNNDPTQRYAEPGVIEVSLDANNNGLADDEWFVIPGSHLGPAPVRVSKTYNAQDFPPGNVPPGRTGTWTVQAYQLSDPELNPAIIDVTLGVGDTTSRLFGYADCAPTLKPGDIYGTNNSVNLAIDPGAFYTVPANPHAVRVSKFSGGGDAISIGWALREGGAPANLPGIDFVRITTGTDVVRLFVGESSTEITGVAEVRPRLRADIAGADGRPGPDGLLTASDVVVFFQRFFAGDPLADIADGSGASAPDGLVTGSDVVVFFQGFFSGD